jgi:hypothetical protein
VFFRRRRRFLLTLIVLGEVPTNDLVHTFPFRWRTVVSTQGKATSLVLQTTAADGVTGERLERKDHGGVCWELLISVWAMCRHDPARQS